MPSSSQHLIQSTVDHAVRVLLCALLCGGAGSASGANLVVNVLERDGKPLAGAVITAEPESAPSSAAPPVKAIMDQVNLAFLPDVLVIPVHSTVQFPNSDAVGHQVYSFSSARRFQLPLYRGKPYPPVSFDQPGIITLGCNIHDNMAAFIVVTAAPFFGRTDDKGAWTIPNLPDGLYRLKIWHPLLKDQTKLLERSVRIAAGNNDVTLRIEDVTRPVPLKGRPHSWEY